MNDFEFNDKIENLKCRLLILRDEWIRVLN